MRGVFGRACTWCEEGCPSRHTVIGRIYHLPPWHQSRRHGFLPSLPTSDAEVALCRARPSRTSCGASHSLLRIIIAIYLPHQAGRDHYSLRAVMLISGACHQSGRQSLFAKSDPRLVQKSHADDGPDPFPHLMVILLQYSPVSYVCQIAD